MSSLCAFAILAAGCADDDSNAGDAEIPTSFPGTAVEDADLVIEPEVLRPGDTARIVVDNRSGRRLQFGLDVTLFEAEGGQWNPTSSPAGANIPYVLVEAKPHSKSGPRYSDDLIDAFRVPPELEAGAYLVGKRVSPPTGDAWLYGTFEIRSAG